MLLSDWLFQWQSRTDHQLAVDQTCRNVSWLVGAFCFSHNQGIRKCQQVLCTLQSCLFKYRHWLRGQTHNIWHYDKHFVNKDLIMTRFSCEYTLIHISKVSIARLTRILVLELVTTEDLCHNSVIKFVVLCTLQIKSWLIAFQNEAENTLQIIQCPCFGAWRVTTA